MSEKSHSREPFHKQHGKRAQTLLESGRRQLYHIYWSLWTKFSWKKSILALCKISRLFINTLTADEKYFFLSRDKLKQPIQILLSKKRNTFAQFFSEFLIFTLNFEHFQREYDPGCQFISQITDSQKGD